MVFAKNKLKINNNHNPNFFSPPVSAVSAGRVPQLHEGAAEPTGRPLRVRDQRLQPAVRQLHGKQRATVEAAEGGRSVVELET